MAPLMAPLTPSPGTFIRPVGRGYFYCYEVLRVVPSDDEGPAQWQCQRWGMKDGQPFNDGHRNMSYLNDLQPVGADAWKDPRDSDYPRWSCCPLYYRRIEVGGQKELFA